MHADPHKSRQILSEGAQVENMTQKHHVYMTKDGRISLAGAPTRDLPFPTLCPLSYLMCSR